MNTPRRCPLIETCEQAVSEFEFEAICMSPDWIFCDHAAEKALEYFKLPREWMKEHEEED